jgi:ferrochelatase
MRLAVVLANLGGPDSPAAVRPFLFNLFNDAAIIGAPQPLRVLLAKFISSRRAPVAAAIYAHIGGRSPILEQTELQAQRLEALLLTKLAPGAATKVFVAMRYWHPLVAETAAAVKAWGPDRIVLLPLYPQFSTTTTASFFDAWDKSAAKVGLAVPTARVCCYPLAPGFLAAHKTMLGAALAEAKAKGPFRLLFSAHGLPQRVVAKGDPYPWQVEQTAAALAQALNWPSLDWRVSYQSRVGPLAWIGPATDDEIRRAGNEGKGLVIVPIAFVSEHSETLVELDLDYAQLAGKSGVPFYLRVPTLGAQPYFIEALAELAQSASPNTGLCPPGGKRLCPAAWACCPASANLVESAA